MTTCRCLLLLLLVAGCGGGQEPSISRERFIAVNVALRSLDSTVTDTLAARREILEEHGVTREQLLGFVEAVDADPSRLADVWREISRQLEEKGVRAEQRVAPKELVEIPIEGAPPGPGLPELPVGSLGEIPPPELSPEGGEEGLPREADQP